MNEVESFVTRRRDAALAAAEDVITRAPPQKIARLPVQQQLRVEHHPQLAAVHRDTARSAWNTELIASVTGRT